MSPGDMGQAVGGLLKRHGLRVITSIEGRSARTQALAARAGIEPVADDQVLAQEADILLSIMVPAQAEPFAERIAPAIEQSARPLTYVDCNAIAPETSKRIGERIEAAGGVFVDAGIIGPPPRESSEATRFYASGLHADRFAVLNEHGLDIRVIGETLGDASAVKMCYAALTKGTTALMTGLSLTAERLGVSDALRAEFEISQGAMLARMRGQVPAMVPKAHRWVGEMEEIAKTFQSAGVTPKIFEGAAAVYQDVAKSALAQVTQEEWNGANKSYDDVIEDLARDE
jgi:3-hydroxyisobutyrate dehydrogenase-like beta-hydroxyacid dehydrogenase